MAKIVLNQEKNGVEIFFDGKPSTDVLAQLHELNFRWHRQEKKWYAKQTEERIKFANSLTDTVENIAKLERKNYDLWEMTRTDNIVNQWEQTGSSDYKAIAKAVRQHLHERFPFCKWSVTSRWMYINISLLSGPFAKDSDETKAIVQYARCYVSSFNYDNSDAMSDYFDVNFYTNASIIAWDYQQREANDEEKQMAEEFQQKKAMDEKAKAEQAAREYAQRKEERKKQEAEYAARRETEKKNIQAIEQCAVVRDVDYWMTGLLYPGLNKDSSIEEYEQDIDDKFSKREDAKITREIHLPKNEFNNFRNMLLCDFSFLDALGGTATDRDKPYEEMSREERKNCKIYGVDWVAVFCDDELKFVVDPEGFAYARYVYFVDEQTKKIDTYATWKNCAA